MSKLQTVYNFGSVSYTKDLVFGWAMSTDHQKTWKVFSDCTEMELRATARGFFPVYVPEELKEAANKALAVVVAYRATQEAEAAELASVMKEMSVDKTEPAETERKSDKVNLAITMLENAVAVNGVVEYRLNYATVTAPANHDTPWQIQTASSKKVVSVDSIHDVMNYILRVFW